MRQIRKLMEWIPNQVLIANLGKKSSEDTKKLDLMNKKREI